MLIIAKIDQCLNFKTSGGGLVMPEGEEFSCVGGLVMQKNVHLHININMRVSCVCPYVVEKFNYFIDFNLHKHQRKSALKNSNFNNAATLKLPCLTFFYVLVAILKQIFVRILFFVAVKYCKMFYIFAVNVKIFLSFIYFLL